MIFSKVRKKNRLAVSLAEILMAVALMGVAALPIFGILNYASRGTRDQEAEAEAGNLAKEEMNRLMYVVSAANLLEDSGKDRPCSFAGNKNEVNRKGNIFSGFYTVYPHDNSKIKFSIPLLNFHNPQECSRGAETHDGVVKSEPEVMSLKELYPDNDKPLLADIYLEIKWRLPSQKGYDKKNKIVLYGRRYFNIDK